MKALILGLLFLATIPFVQAATEDDMDHYKWRVNADWWFSNPTGSFRGVNNNGSFDLSRNFGFGSYSTFSGRVDWRFKRKHHIILGVNPVKSTRTVTLKESIEFQGVTYDLGAQVTADITSLSFAPGYQYDIFRRNRWYLAIDTQVYLLNTKGSLKGIGTVNGASATRTTSGSIFAGLPVVGPRFRCYPLRSDRLSLDGFVQGMYFFGYGSFVSARGTAGVKFRPHWRLDLGYQMGTRLSIHGSSNQIGVRLTQKGPVAGVEASW